MLTDSEREWVAWKIRIRCDESIAPAWCHHCQHLGKDWGGCYQQRYCPLFSWNYDWQDAAEFEGRVAAKLAKHIHNKPLVCETNWDCPYWPQGKCAWCYLKAARLEVEEEMYNEP